MKKIIVGFLYGVFAAGFVSGINGIILFFFPQWLSFPPPLSLVAQVSFIEEAVKLIMVFLLSQRTLLFLPLSVIGVGFGIAEMALYWFSRNSLNISSLVVHPILVSIVAWAVILVRKNGKRAWWYGIILIGAFGLHFLWNYNVVSSFPK